MSTAAVIPSGTNTGLAKQDALLDMKTLFVRSIPLDKTDEDLSEFFSNFAPIKHAVVVKDKDHKSRGFGFVSFAVEDDTKEALSQARKTKLDGHLLRVDIAKRRNRNKGETGEQVTKTAAFQQDENEEEALLKGKPKLIIRNMPWSCRDPNKLKKVFGRFGMVIDATIPRKPDGKLRGFAFVTMKKISNCKLAIENSKDLKIDGRPVAVDFAVQKNIWEDHKNKNQEEEEREADEEEDDDDDGEGEDGDDDDDDDKKREDSQSEELQSDDEESSGQESDRVSSDQDISEEEGVGRNTVSKRPPQNRQESFSVFVRNVPYDATEESLAEHFSKFGPVKYALPVIDKDTGLAKGTAFVAFRNQSAYDSCLENAPAAGATSLLIGDDVLPEYVYEGRVLSISPTLKKEQANIMAEKNANKRRELLGKAPGEKDRRSLYLLNEGKVVEGSKLATLLSEKDMDVRNASYALRVEQLKKNPSLHLSLTRLAIRNLPRAMNDKALKALARKAIVEFAAQVKEGVRHPLSKEELVRSTKEKYRHMTEEEIEHQKKKDRKHGVVKQAKVIMEVKGSTKGRSRGYGFVEFKDHKHALMGLRWMNVHQVTKGEILAGLNEEEKKHIDMDNLKSRRLCVEFAIENANVLKRRREHEKQSRGTSKKDHRENESTQADVKRPVEDNKVKEKRGRKDSGLSDDTKRLIGIKRRKKNSRR